jgi:hypothetical protein
MDGCQFQINCIEICTKGQGFSGFMFFKLKKIRRINENVKMRHIRENVLQILSVTNPQNRLINSFHF